MATHHETSSFTNVRFQTLCDGEWVDAPMFGHVETEVGAMKQLPQILAKFPQLAERPFRTIQVTERVHTHRVTTGVSDEQVEAAMSAPCSRRGSSYGEGT